MNNTFTFLLVLALSPLAWLSGQDFFLPVSTSSAEARTAYHDASRLGSNVRMDAARLAIDRALEADPDFFMAYAYRIQVLADKDDKPTLIDRALAIDHQHFTPAERIMRDYLKDLKKDAEAKPTEAMKKLVATYPRTPEALEWGYLHAAYTDKDLDAAFDYAHQLMELAPDFAPVHNSLGYFHMQRKEMAEAKKHFDRYLAMVPDEANAYDSMAEYFSVTGDYARSAAFYQQAAQRGMQQAEARAAKALEQLYTAEAPEGSAPADQLARDVRHVESVWDRIINGRQIDEINTDHFTADVVLAGGPAEIAGIDAFRDYYNNYLTGFTDIEFTVEDAFGQEDRLVKHWRFRGKHTGNFFGVPATGNVVDVEGVTLIRMRDGKIAREQDFMDNMLFTQQLGLLPNPGNLAVIEGLYNSFSTGDISAVLAALDAEVVWNEAEGNELAKGNPYIGPDAVLNGVFAPIAEEHEYFRLKDIELHAMDGNQVLATLRYDARLKESGRQIDAQAAHLWTLRDGKVTAFQQYIDTRQLAEAAKK